MDNGRDKTKPIIPAKLEAYQALICSGSIPVTMPKILIVNDCNVTFRENVIKINDECEGEPELTFEKDYEIEYFDSDGYGLMSPSYSRIINRDLYGEKFTGQTISGVNTRYAWTKGMLFTFDFVEFAKKVNHGNYIIKDAWGEYRDVRNYDVILTTSMVKLWDSYKNLEHFIQCCNENHYQFSVAKTTPHKLENVRNANYQFLQTYELTDKELYELCKPTIDEIALFRAPMTCHNNIRRRKVVHNEEIDFCYQYNTTGIILNSWDTTCDALNGADKDSDTFFSTNNKIILEHTLNSPTIECMQRKAEKIIPTENDMIQSNKLAFGDEIGTTTNRITAMIERQAVFDKNSDEYNIFIIKLIDHI